MIEVRPNTVKRLLSILSFLMAASFGNSQPTSVSEITRSQNPHPGNLPSLTVSERQEWGQDFIYLSAEFPNVPGLVCDLWCFEAAGIQFSGAKAIESGGIEMRHRWEGHDWEVVSIATPHPGALEFVARLEAMNATQGGELTEYPGLNVCWQLRSAPGFASKPDPYPEFVKRCFIFTEKGMKFLHELGRRPIPVQAATSEHNNPPWVQMYAHLSAGEVRAGTNSWADYSPDRYVLPIIGAVSRTGEYLTALASGSNSTLSQAWHDCMHNNPKWLPAKDGNGKEWRIRIYAMENDPEELIRRYRKDFLAFTVK